MKITLNGIETTVAPLTWGQVKANKDLLDSLTETGISFMDRTTRAADFLHLALPDADLDALPPVVLIKGGVDLYSETFFRTGEEKAPETQSL